MTTSAYSPRVVAHEIVTDDTKDYGDLIHGRRPQKGDLAIQIQMGDGRLLWVFYTNGGASMNE